MDFQSANTFSLKQRITPLINRYEYFVPTEGDREERIAFVEQKRFKLREEIIAWRSEDRQAVVFTLKAEKVMDIHGNFIVTTGDGERAGHLRKAFGKSLLRSTWEVFRADGTLAFVAQEENLTIAIVRRFGALIPVLGDLLQYLPFNFQFLVDGVRVGGYKRILGIRDNYVISLEPAAKDVDRRLVLALGIALDALQDR